MIDNLIKALQAIGGMEIQEYNEDEEGDYTIYLLPRDKSDFTLVFNTGKRLAELINR